MENLQRAGFQSPGHTVTLSSPKGLSADDFAHTGEAGGIWISFDFSVTSYF